MNAELIEVALSTYGIKEVPGTADNPVILQWAKEAGFPDYIHDEISWCSLAMNYWAMKAGYQRSHKLNARSWLNIGTIVSEPEIGDVVIFWRGNPNGWQGHVAIWIRRQTENIYTLGGNQADQISIAPFPKERVLGYRRLNKAA